MLDHISLRVSDFGRAIAFFKAALAPLGYELVMEFPGYAGFGVKGKPDFWVTTSDKPINPTHVALAADRKSIDAFHAAALAAGGTDNGAPGLRADYHPNYYGAFILDLDGNNIEAVSHASPEAAKKQARPAAQKAPKKAPKKSPKKAAKKAPKKSPKRVAKAKPKAKAKAKTRRR